MGDLGQFFILPDFDGMSLLEVTGHFPVGVDKQIAGEKSFEESSAYLKVILNQESCSMVWAAWAQNRSFSIVLDLTSRSLAWPYW